ncbi:interaptin-like [Eupeodes corollae]|uniref:interaptin-like n=1 Tax=Eupeodes corollae TaxID=290404 RepID=UPI002493A3C4|nr:interaptin-like [Eupeodes corollae]
MDSAKINNLNEKSELKAFMAKIRAGNLVRLIEANQLQFEEKCSYLTQKLKKSEEEMRRKISILQQNSHLIEKFQKQLQELSDQNTELLSQQQEIKDENENLNAQLQCSEDKFAQLDVLYDQQITELTERNNELLEKNNELEQQLSALECSQEQSIDQFDKTQRNFNEMLTKSEQRNTNLLNELNNLHAEKGSEIEKLKSEISQLKDILNQRTIDYEERIQDLQTSLSSAMDGKKEIHELEHQIENLNHERKADQKAFDSEKCRATAANDELKATIEELTNKLCTKEKEVQEVYLKFKQITRLGAATPTAPATMQSANFVTRKRASPDDPQPFDDSTDSDASSVSFYKGKCRRNSTDLDEKFENVKKSEAAPKNQFRKPTFGYKRKVSKNYEPIEIPESPVVSSSAFGNHDKKL